MNENKDLRILPLRAKPVVIDEIDPTRVKAGLWPVGVGCLFYTVVGGAAGMLVEATGSDTLMVITIVIIVCGSIFTGVKSTGWIKRGKLERLETRRADELRQGKLREAEAVQREAQEATERARSTLDRLRQLLGDISSPLEKASRTLGEARKEYGEKAYASFWDRVERAAIQLAGFQERVREVGTTVALYRGLLEGRDHNFPDFVVSPDTIPSPKRVLQEFREVARMGEKDFQFAMIWEQRKTREVVVAGFHTLEEAVQNLGRSLERSMFELGASITVDVDRAIEEGKAERTRQLDSTERQVKLLEEIRDDSKKGPSRF